MKNLKDFDFSELSNILSDAADTTSEGITISSMKKDDQALIYVNSGFEKLTGYLKEDVLGKNCRFLQGDNTSEESVEKIRSAIRNGEECTVELLNYKKNGIPFWNRLAITPLKNENGEVEYYVGIQSDITELKETRKKLQEANNELHVFQDRIQKDLDQAQILQRFILPDPIPENPSVRFYSFTKPTDEIGGDFFDIIELDEDTFGILCADVTGHGIPAALLTNMTSYAFKNSAFGVYSSKKVITQTNKKLYSKMPKGQFVTMFYAIYDSRNKILTYTQAGHPNGLLIRPSSNLVIPLESDGMLVGAIPEEMARFGEMKINLEKGDKVILFTDAIIELKSDHEMITEDHLVDFIQKNCKLPLPQLYTSLYEFGLSFTGKEKFDDDLTFIGLEVI